MTAVLLAILTMSVVGLPIVIAIDRTARGPLLLGLAFLYGSAASMFALMLLSVLQVSWTATNATATLLAAGALAGVAIVRERRRETLAPNPACRPRPFSAHALDSVTVILICCYMAFVTIASLWEWDFWAIWGLKARVFLEYGGIDWVWLKGDWNGFAHADYPLLVPLNYDFVGLLHGSWNDRWLGILSAAWATAALLAIRAIMAEEVSSWIAAAATASSAIIAMSFYIGLAEAALIAFSGTGLLFLRSAISDRASAVRDWRHGAVLLGLAANCKNEGIALVAVTAVAIVIADPRRWRRVLRLWPSIALMAPWTLLRMAHALPNDLASGNVIGRFLGRAASPNEVTAILVERLHDPWAWLLVIATFLIVPHATTSERFILCVTSLQIALFVAAYFATPQDVAWHVATSWHRLTRQVQLPITVVCALHLARFAFDRKELASAAQ